jgi:outer membrane biosynthesis protein TonB
MEIEIVLGLGIIIAALAYFVFRKRQEESVPADVVKTEQYVQITPEPIAGTPIATVVEPVQPVEVTAPVVTTVTHVPEVTQAVKEFEEPKVEVKPEPKPVAKKPAAKTPAKPKTTTAKAKKKK